MPLYEYLCPSCGTKIEKRNPMSQEPFEKCPVCPYLAQKIPSVVNFSFGWTFAEESHLRGHPDYLVKDVGVNS